MSLALLFHHLRLNMFRILVHPSSGACDLLWIYFMCCIALIRCMLVLRCGSTGWCGIFMHAEALVLVLEGSETSAVKTKTPGNYPKENILQLNRYFTVPKL